MKMNERDRRALILLAVAAPLMGIFLFGGRIRGWLAEDGEGQASTIDKFDRLFIRLESAETWQEKIAAQQTKLKIKVSEDPVDQQIYAFTKAVEDAGQKSQVKPSFTQPPAKTTSGKVAISHSSVVSCTAPFPAIVNFLKELESQTMPIMIDEITLNKAGGSGSRNQPPQGGQGGQAPMSANFKLRVLLFPEAG